MTQALALGIDIGGTNTIFGIVNKQGQILAQGSISTTAYPVIEDYIEALISGINKLTKNIPKGSIIGIGIGAPNGNFYTGEITFAPNLPWKGIIPLAKLIGDALQVKATLTNDANAAAIGEMTYGAAKGMKDFIMVTLGTGLGSGFVANGQLIYGHDGLAGELGHVIVEPRGRKCGCGRHGCLERYASATGIVITAEEWLLSHNDETPLRKHASKITARNIHEAALKGDSFALEIFEYTGKILGFALANAVAITSPEAVILFGGLAQSGEILFKPVRYHMEDNMLNIYKNKVKLLASALPDADAAILGASALAWQA